MATEEVTLAEILRQNGYQTGIGGKWHLGDNYPYRASKQGFDLSLVGHGGGIGQPGDHADNFFRPDSSCFNTTLYKNNIPVATKGYSTDAALDFLNDNQQKPNRTGADRPFFLYLSHYAVHTKLAGKPEDVAKYRQKAGVGTKQNNPELAAMLERIDDGVGQLVETLTELGLLDNTLILFTSDNGGELNVTSNAPLRGGKSELFEGGIRKPFIAYWPGTIKPGGVSNQVINTLDIYPTLLELASIKPANDQPLDGISIASVLKGRTKPFPRTLYWHYPLPKPHFLGGRSAGAIRAGDLKLIEYFDNGQPDSTL